MCNPDIANKCIAPAALNAFRISSLRKDLSPMNNALLIPKCFLGNHF